MSDVGKAGQATGIGSRDVSVGRKANVSGPRLAPTWAEAGVLFLFVFATTWVAWLVRPSWDDGWIELMHASGRSLQQALGDRPVYGAYLTWLHEHGMLWSVHLGVHLFGWFAQGAAAMAVWSLFFPASPRFRLTAGCLTIAPVICQYQMLIVGGTIYLIQVAAVFLGFVCIYWAVQSRAALWWKGAILLLTGANVFLNTLVSEYTVPAALAAAVLLWFLLGARGRPLRTRVLATAWLPAIALGGYSLYYLIADAAVRPDVRPEKIILGAANLTSLLTTSLGNLASELWQLCLGRTLAGLGRLRIEPTAGGMLVFGLGGLVAAAIVWASLRQRDASPDDRLEILSAARTAGVFLLAISLGLLPIVLIGRVGTLFQMETRYWLPVLPIAACTTVLLIRSFAREKLTAVVIAILALVCGYVAVDEARRELQRAAQTRASGRALHTMLTPEGINVAFFVYEAPDTRRAWVTERSYELTAALTADWPTKDRNRFWAWAARHGQYEVPNPPADLGVALRAVLRSGPVAKFLWVSVDENGRMRRVLERSPVTDHWSSPRP